ncbi:hypothetical protein [Paenibacillus sedimenti]|uniref:EF-hand domain-containing protein n=1 Tax=Paenibacillus sedimenti TaxID=2770274 RepID=A0A926KTT9_9BACL|nr:hypothetical protein [Paenibacillus sedimenti]MBD0383178.1 hypothetical protein [Paenibacillus sedimenti]
MRKWMVSLVLIAMLLGQGASMANAAISFDSNGDGKIRLDEIVRYMQSNHDQDINGDGSVNVQDTKELLSLISPEVVESPIQSAVVTGMVYDQLHVPVQGAAVRLNGESLDESDDFGWFNIDDVLPGSGNILTAEKYGRQAATQPFTVTAKVGDTSTHNLQLDLPTGTVTGTVYASENVPLGQVEVSVLGGEPGIDYPKAITDSDGKYVLYNVPIGMRMLLVTPLSYAIVGSIEVQEGLNPGIDLTNVGYNFITVSGKAADSHGIGLANATITMKQGIDIIQTATSDEDGRFEFNSVIPNMHFSWHLQKEGYMDASWDGLSASDNTSIVGKEFRTVTSAPITTDLEMKYAFGTMAKSFYVNLGGYEGLVERSLSTYSLLKSKKPDDSEDQIAFVGGTDSINNDDIERLNAALRDSSVSQIYLYDSIAAPGKTMAAPERDVTIFSNSEKFIQAQIPVTARLQWTNVTKIPLPYHQVVGIVRDENKQPRPLAFVNLELNGIVVGSVLTDNNGFYFFDNLNAGSAYTITVNRGEYYEQRKDFIAPNYVNAYPILTSHDLELTAQHVANFLDVKNPSKGANKFPMPLVPAGYSVSIENSSDILKIKHDGEIMLGNTNVSVTLTFKVTYGTMPAGYRAFTVTVPANN